MIGLLFRRRISAASASAPSFVEPLEARCLLSGQPDLQIKLKAESTYVGDHVYNATGAGQSRSSSGNAVFPVVYHVRIQNDGPDADSFTLQVLGARRNRWRVRTYDSQVTGYDGGVNVSDAAATGWKTGPIAAGASRDIRVEVLPLPGARGGDSRTVTITATSRTDGRSDTVTATTTYTPAQLVEIRRQNFDSSGEYLYSVQNRGNLPDHIKVTGPAKGRSYSVRYFDAPVGGNDVTAAVTSGGWVSPTLAPGEMAPLRVELSARRHRVRTFQLNASSTASSAKTDFAMVTNAPSDIAPPTFFSIGVWSPIMSSFDRWKARGINTLVQYESASATIDQWTQAAVDRGLYMIRRPRPNPADDIGQKYLIAWAHPDEPDIASTGHPASFIASEYAKWKAINPKMPVWVNFSGGFVDQWQGTQGYKDYKPFLDATDWVSSSVYPVAGWSHPDNLDLAGLSVDRLEKWSQGKPQFAAIETGNQALPWMPSDSTGPTPGQFKAEIWDSIIRGARGIIYFPQRFKPTFSYDDTPPEVVDEMIRQNARMTALGPVLLSPSDPATLGFEADAPLEASWRFYTGKAYFVVLNMSGRTLKDQPIYFAGTGKAKSATVTFEKRTVGIHRGSLTDSFAPFETHVYEVG